jgi:hypothetical protein
MRFPLLSLFARDAEDRIARTRLNHGANIVASLVVATFATTTPCSAQVKVEFTPFVGSYVPTADLFPAGTLPNAASAARVRQKTGLALGGRVTAWVTDRFAIDGSYGYSGSGVEHTESLTAHTDMCCAYLTLSTAGHLSTVSTRLLFVVVGRPSSTALYILGGRVR